jgi:glycosyltransferase involved in cell wall biosynthesis
MTALNSTNPVRVSVALVTHNRPQSLTNTLASIRNQQEQPWEVVVSDDSDPEAARENEQIAAAYDCRYVRGPQRGVFANRNRAALACTGTHVRTMDDDHRFPDDHFRTCRRVVERDPHSIWAIGEYNLGSPHFHPPTQLTYNGAGEIPPNYDDCWAIADASTIFPASIFDAGHRYYEDLPFGVNYLEFGSRLYWLGYRCRIMTSTFVYHMDDNQSHYTDPELFTTTYCFASFAHCLMYRRSLGNAALCLLKMIKQPLVHGPRGGRAVASALDHFFRLRQQLAHAPTPHESSSRHSSLDG